MNEEDDDVEARKQPSYQVRATLRNMAWQRAKGELAAMLETCWGDWEGFPEADKLVDEFVENMEDLL